MASDLSWSSVSTEVLLAELDRRDLGATKRKPQCGSGDRGTYNTPLHLAALALILFVSTLACAFPLFSRRISSAKSSPNSLQSRIIFLCQHFGTGVLLATGFVHLLPTAFSSLNDPCLPYLFNEGYPPLPGFIAMCSALVIVSVEMYLATRGAGHSHSHSHGEWDDADSQYNKIEGNGHDGHGSRAHARNLSNASQEDAEATESLVSAVSPLPGSTPMVAAPNRHSKSGQHFTDEDSDFDADDLDDPLATDHQASASGSHDFGSELDIQDVPESALAEQRRRLLQCVLLEAGILFHSIFIGMAISVATGPAFVVFLIAISFHQCFEGLALGSRIAALQFPKRSLQPWLMVLAFGATTPIGQAIGLLVHGLYDPQSQTGLLMVGVMNAISAGLLLFAGLVQLLAEDFLSEKSYETLNGTRRRNAYIAVVSGAMLMSLVGAFA
ncbi:hypothetical protein BROUX41_000146 [Berkeleyomyces rouxiae]|uniref:uncharacterized protein n=1 Tax=Berkeleyomyces rouxiae TaxID=2035830 RepID=UPI003B78CF74